MNVVRCLTYQHVVRRDERRLQDCLCDSDAPTWIALQRDGRLLTFSASRWENCDE